MVILERLLNKIKDFRKKQLVKSLHFKCSKKKYLTDWEKTFIKSLEGKFTLSDKQILKLTEISEKRDILRGRHQLVTMLDDSWSYEENTNQCFCEKHGVSWGDVHDFDRD